MDYNIYTVTNKPDTTALIEIGPGKYSGNHWRDDFIFVSENSFIIMEIPLLNLNIGYDHYGMNDYDASTGMLICDKWGRLMDDIKNTRYELIYNCSHLRNITKIEILDDLLKYNTEMLNFIHIIEMKCRFASIENNGFCILGM